MDSGIGTQRQLSVLRKVSKADVVDEPFPHVIVRGALDDELAAQLTREFPPLSVVTRGARYASNERFSYSKAHAPEDAGLDQCWKDVLAYHTSTAFLREVVALFEDHIRSMYPELERRVGSLDDLRAGVRKVDDYTVADVLLDAQICVNTPVVKPSPTVRPPHVDNDNKLFAGLYYLRDSTDASSGGDLELYSFSLTGGRRPFDGQFLDREHVEVVKTVPYEQNTLVLLLNSVDSLHGVTCRSVTDVPRRFMNLLGEVEEPLFDLVPFQAPLSLGVHVQRSTRAVSEHLRASMRYRMSRLMRRRG